MIGLTINHLPPKYCTYSCVYCLAGNTIHMTDQIQFFYDPDEVFRVTYEKVKKLIDKKETVDFISLAPDGEPTLDVNLGEIILRLKEIGFPIAIVSNGSLFGNQYVRENLHLADWINVKIDTVDFKIWQKINQPLESLNLNNILDGIIDFAKSYNGILVTETMLIKDINDSPEIIENTAKFISKVNPLHAYLLVPTLPPAESWVQSPDEQHITELYYLFKKYFRSVTMQMDSHSKRIHGKNSAEEQLLTLASAHPLRKDVAERLIKKNEKNQELINHLLKENRLVETTHSGKAYYIRKLE